MTDAAPTADEDDLDPRSLHPDPDGLDYVWDVEEELAEATDVDLDDEDHEIRAMARQMRRWRAVAVRLTIRDNGGYMDVIKQDGDTGTYILAGRCEIDGDSISVLASERDFDGQVVRQRWWTIRPTAGPVRHRSAG